MVMKPNKVIDLLILIFILAAVVQTEMLWLGDTAGHNFFYSFFDNRKNAAFKLSAGLTPILPQQVIIGYGNKRYHAYYPQPSADKMQQTCLAILSKAMATGKAEEWQPVQWEDLLSSKTVVYEFPFPMSITEYAKGLKSKLSKDMEKISSFDCLILSPGKEASDSTDIYFVNDERKESCLVTITGQNETEALYNAISSMQQEEQDLSFISTKQNNFNMFQNNCFLPQWKGESYRYAALRKEIPFQANGMVSQELLEKGVKGFFKSTSPQLNKRDEEGGFYTVSNETTVVKYYSNNIMEYYNYDAYGEGEEQTLVTAYYACMEFLKTDSTLENDIFLAGAEMGSDGLVFYFDYVINNIPILLSDDITARIGSSHSIAVTLNHNQVKGYRRLMYTFQENKEKDQRADLDFVTAVDATMLEFKETSGQERADYEGDAMEDITLGYFLDSSDELTMVWFSKMYGQTYWNPVV